MKKIVHIALLCFAAFFAEAQDQQVVDSIWKVLPTIPNAEKEPYYSELAWQYLHVDVAKCQKYADKALELARKFGDSTQLADAYNTKGATCFRAGEFDASIRYNKAALHLRKLQHDERGMAGSYSKLGLVYIEQGDFQLALDLQLKALRYFLKCKDQAGEAQTYNNICQIYYYMENFDMAIRYANKCMKAYQGIDYPYGEGAAIMNMAMYYEELKMFDSCIYYMDQALQVFKSINDVVDAAVAENSLGYYYREIGDEQKGLAHYKEAYRLGLEAQDESSVTQYMANLGASHLALGHYPEALSYYSQALKKAQTLELKQIIRQCYGGLSEYYEKTNDFKKALEYRKKYQEIKERITSEEMQKSMLDADAKFQSTLKEKKILEQEKKLIEERQRKAELEGENALKDARLANTQLLWLLIVSALIVLTVIVLWRLNKRKIEQKREFTEALAAEQKRGFERTIAAGENERQRIARDLHDGIVQDIVALKIDLKDMSDVSLKAHLLGKLDSTANEIRNISHQMMPFALKELGLIAATRDLLERSLASHGLRFEYQALGEFTPRLPAAIEISLYRIVQELLNNAIKHSGADQLSLTISLRNQQVVLVYEDNGKGLGADLSAGVGLENLRTRTQVLNGRLELESAPGQGLTLIFYIPMPEKGTSEGKLSNIT